MKHFLFSLMLSLVLVPSSIFAQSVDQTKYPDYNTNSQPDYSLLENPGNYSSIQVKGTRFNVLLPDHVDNSTQKCFPPVFNQDGGSCGSASRISYMFTHEINAYRRADAKLLSNRYPSHFVWLLTFGNSGKEDFAINVGVPNAEVYGGTTYSQTFGNQEASQSDFGWMQGYDKWLNAMSNRMASTHIFPTHLGTQEGREALKRWLYNHNGDNDFMCGGIAGIGVASEGQWEPIGSTPTNNQIGVTGKKYVYKWGTGVDHAMTIVGYDDRIEFDLNGNGIAGETNANERGAWILVNSWGRGWCNDGFVYCPYAYAGPTFNTNGQFSGEFWTPEIYRVRKDYRPLRTIKLKMEYFRRSEIRLSAGISTDLNATEPERSIQFDHFKFAGDGNNGQTDPAPEVPMLGRWADGKLHREPMEFGYDLTDLTANFDKSKPLKYFFIIENRGKDKTFGSGIIHEASIVDYEFEKKGIETPFDIPANGVEIRYWNEKTIISTVVYGESYYAPQNLSLVGNQLYWDAPLRSVHPLKGYKLYRDGQFVSEFESTQRSCMVSDLGSGITYGVSAVYNEGAESTLVKVKTPVSLPGTNQATDFKHSGFAIPNIFKHKFNEVTIEYWMNPHSLRDWNQSGGPGWGTFLFHANGNGSFTAGWSTGEHRTQTGTNKLRTNTWTHVAITVKDNTMKVYINGTESGSVTSNTYSGLGGFGDLTFRPNNDRDNIDAKIDEIRIWNYARSAQDISNYKDAEFSGNILPNGLIAYYKGDVMSMNGKTLLREYISQNHAEILNGNYSAGNEYSLNLHAPQDNLTLNILQPSGMIYKGIPATFKAQHSNSISKLIWTAEMAGVNNLQTAEPSLTFMNTGYHTISVDGYNAGGQSVRDQCTVMVYDPPLADASFTTSKAQVSSGERVTFVVSKPMFGYFYKWSMPGADIETATSLNASTTYNAKGEYTVTLTVTGPDGREVKNSKTISVKEIAPLADFEVRPTTVLKGRSITLKDKSKYTPTSWEWSVKSSTSEMKSKQKDFVFTPKVPGRYDVILKVSNGSGSHQTVKEHALTVCNADSKNGINFNNGRGRVVMGATPFARATKTATIEWWMNAKGLKNHCNGMGEQDKIEIKTTGIGQVLINMGMDYAESYMNYIIANEWHHYAIVFDCGQVTFYRDAEFFCSSQFVTQMLPKISSFALGTDDAPMSGQMDEFRIWSTALSAEKLHTYANAPIENITQAMSEDKLSVYYNFDQSSGNVIDHTTNHNNGSRYDFGPDGDAWGLSRGVFCLDEKEEVPQAFNLNIDEYGYATVYLPHSVVIPDQMKAFLIIKKVDNWLVMSQIEDGIIPSETGVIVVGETGIYRLEPSTDPGSPLPSVLSGVLTNKKPEEGKRYYELDASAMPGFSPLKGNELKANQAYFIRPADETCTFFRLADTTVGIEKHDAETTQPIVIYDISGRQVTVLERGKLYIINGKKVFFE